MARRERSLSPSPSPARGRGEKARLREPPIGVDGREQPPLGMPPARFLRDYWQKRPLLIRQAFPNYRSPLLPDELAGLACESFALSRIVVHDPQTDAWSVETGPFEEARFASLPDEDWTLLVQDVDKWDRDVAALLEHFRFLPDWRLDDVMISYAAPDGSVGPHVDQYDVFLLQAMGYRHWMIATDPKAPTAFRPDQELKLLQRFEPDEEWLLEPGDMLYLPPGLPHHGVAAGEAPCMTFSIGLRAPSLAELAADFAEHVAERLPEHRRYADPDLQPAAEPGEIDAAALKRVRRLLAEALDADDAAQAEWFGRFITRYRAAGFAQPRPRPLSPAAFRKRLGGGGVLRRHPLSRFAFRTHGRRAQLFVAGDAYEVTRDLAQRLCRAEPLPLAQTRRLDDDSVELLRGLVNHGHLEFAR